MAQSSISPFKVALLWRGDRQARRDARPQESHLKVIFAALVRRGVDVEPAVYSEEMANEVREQLLEMDGVLVWVDPISGGERRDALNDLLRDVSSAGVFVGAHPDIIDKMGVKAVLARTKTLDWGTDTYFYETPEAFNAEFPRRLMEDGLRVLKQNRSNGGFGVWKVTAQSDGRIEILSARSEELLRKVSLADFMAERGQDFRMGGGLVDQPFQARHLEGMVRCYMSGDRVAGFGHQLIRALADREAGPAGPRLYCGPDDDRFQKLRTSMENQWAPAMARLLEIERSELPIIWDADFLFGPNTPGGQDTYVLCEINVSSVFPIRDEAPDALTASLIRRLETVRRDRSL